MELFADVKEDTGAKLDSKQSFSIFHWNLNSNSAQNNIKLSL